MVTPTPTTAGPVPTHRGKIWDGRAYKVVIEGDEATVRASAGSFAHLSGTFLIESINGEPIAPPPVSHENVPHVVWFEDQRGDAQQGSTFPDMATAQAAMETETRGTRRWIRPVGCPAYEPYPVA